MRLSAAWLVASLMIPQLPARALAQGAPEPSEARLTSRSAHNAREAYRERVNENVLFLMGGTLGAAYIQIAQDIAVVVNDEQNLRVLPVIGAAGVQNVHDVVFLRGIDLALTNVATLNALRKSGELGPNLDRQISYVTTLFPEEMQIVARGSINSLEDLRGKVVNFNNRGSATAQFAPLVFEALGIAVKPVFSSQPDAVQKMMSGEVEATVCFCPMPVPAYAGIPASAGFKMLEVPYNKAFQDDYLPTSISSDDYPNLLPKKEKVDSIAGSTVLVTFNWPRGSTRYARTAKFIDAFFSKFPELQKPPRHPLWKSVNYAAQLKGWQRFPAAQEWLDRSKVQQISTMEAGFAEFVKMKMSQGAVLDLADPEEKERLFREFLEWSKKPRN